MCLKFTPKEGSPIQENIMLKSIVVAVETHMYTYLIKCILGTFVRKLYFRK